MGVTLFKIREADIESYINAVEVPKVRKFFRIF